jgi:hypothetical protein
MKPFIVVSVSLLACVVGKDPGFLLIAAADAPGEAVDLE